MAQTKSKGTIACPHCNGSGRLAFEAVGVGDLVLAARKKSGMTQDQLAKKVGLSRAQIANLEAGRTDTSIKALSRFAEVFGCSMRDLVPGS